MKHAIIALTQLRIAGILVLISMTMMGCHPASPSLPPSTTSTEAPGLPSTLANLSPGLAVVGLDPVDWDDVWIFTGSGKPQRILSECCPSIRRDINADRLQALYASGFDVWLLDTLSGVEASPSPASGPQIDQSIHARRNNGYHMRT